MDKDNKESLGTQKQIKLLNSALNPFSGLKQSQKLRRRRKKKNLKWRSDKNQSLAMLIPNILTLSSLCFGLTAIKMALNGHFEMAVTAILLGAFLDGMDGRVARLLNATSRFGAELDSLADLVSFGISPALVLYFYKLQYFDKLGWCLVLFFCICMALRLARFNVGIIEGTPFWPQGFAKGIPAPAAGLLGLSPLIQHLAYPNILLFQNTAYVSCVVICISLFMVSRIPTFLLKNIKIHPHMRIPLILFILFVMACTYTIPWITLSLVSVCYMALIPFSIFAFKKIKTEANLQEKTL